MFRKILIANRGEIACRVIDTAVRLGIKTVAVYSDADSNALHVKRADEAVHIGAAPASQSYLLSDKIIAAAIISGAEAIHPGYGFLSENAEFCRACEAAGIEFIGPPVGAIESMGSKSAAKMIMGEANVPLVPGYHGDDQSAEVIKQSANEMGYPVLLKAVAGGGGKGMRQVWSEPEFEQALAAAKREALAGFGNDDMLVEKYLTQPRHVEVQVFCDKQGNGVYLFERDCSVQRRHQKVIEEAPAPNMSPALRAEMGEAAVKAAKAIDYVGAGTVEFLLDVDGSFYFMEMNTRLQVEHPVTEMITGEDLVEWQLKVAAGEVLPKTQEQLTISGHSFEARIYAEDPDNDFLPVTGTLSYLKPPSENRHVRVDTGVVQGDEVSVYYDPMIAKLIVWDEDRASALARLSTALTDYHLSGMKTNISFLKRLSDSEPFQQADLDTGFIDKHQELLFAKQPPVETITLTLIGLYLHLSDKQSSANSLNGNDSTSPWNNASDWRMNFTASRTYTFEIGEDIHSIVISQDRGFYNVVANEQELACQATLQNDHLEATISGHRMSVSVVSNDQAYSLFSDQGRTEFSRVLADLGVADDEAGRGFLAPMNGTVIDVLAKPGQSVDAGETLIILEAMKMEHTIRAHEDGVVEAIYFGKGDLVDGGAELLQFTPTES